MVPKWSQMVKGCIYSKLHKHFLHLSSRAWNHFANFSLFNHPALEVETPSPGCVSFGKLAQSVLGLLDFWLDSGEAQSRRRGSSINPPSCCFTPHLHKTPKPALQNSQSQTPKTPTAPKPTPQAPKHSEKAGLRLPTAERPHRRALP